MKESNNIQEDTLMDEFTIIIFKLLNPIRPWYEEKKIDINKNL